MNSMPIDWNQTAELYRMAGHENGIFSTYGQVVSIGSLAEMFLAFEKLGPVDREEHAIKGMTQNYPSAELILPLMERDDFPRP